MGIEATQAINIEMPIVIFAFLFGVSMDYQVFIISRMREAYDRTGSTESAVVEGIGRTGRLVTSAALILGLAFVAFSASPGTEAKIFAVGLGGGILIDATIIRGIHAPAVVALLGRWNWWLPGWAARILRVDPSPVHPDHRPFASLSLCRWLMRGRCRSWNQPSTIWPRRDSPICSASDACRRGASAHPHAKRRSWHLCSASRGEYATTARHERFGSHPGAFTADHARSPTRARSTTKPISPVQFGEREPLAPSLRS